MKRPFVYFIVTCLCLSIFGCSGNTNGTSSNRSGNEKTTGNTADKASNQVPVLSKDPVNVTFAASGGMFPDEDFQQYVVEPVSKKYPQITLQRINTSTKGSKIPDLVSAGQIPDIVTNYPGPMGSTMNDLGMVFNMEPLMKKYRFDTSRLEPEALQTLRIAGNQDYLAGLPAYTNAFALFYNKDIFDKFGVPYPKDGMYWDDVVEVAKKLTRKEDGTQYRGIFPDGIGRIEQQLSIPFIDFKTNKSLLDTQVWHDAFQQWGTLFKIPGLTEGDFKVPNAGKNQTAFIDGSLAMIASHTNMLFMLRKAPQVNWDMVTYPQNKKAPGVGQRLDSPIMSITAQSKVKDAAFLVIDTILSDEVQTNMMKNGRMTVLKDEKIKQQFGKDLTEFQGKNLLAMTKLKFAVMAPFKYLPDGDSDKIISNAFNAYIVDQKDLNTALRDADEQLNQLIKQLLSK